MPQAQAEPVTLLFSLEALSQVHSPAGLAPMNQVSNTSKTCCHGTWTWDLRQEQRAPEMEFSVAFFSQVQFMAFCLPHEHVALDWQTHSSARPQQVVGLTILIWLYW